MRLDHFGDMGHPIDRMAHKFNMTVPGVLGYRPQTADNEAHFDRIEVPGSGNPYLSLGRGPIYTTKTTGLSRI